MKKYPGLIFQKFITGFGESVEIPEVRMYYVGREYQFSMVATETKIYCLSEDGHKPMGRRQNGMTKLPKGADLLTLKNIALKVIDFLQSKVSLTSADGSRLPLLMTRVDMGVMRDGEFKPWVNEVEYVPSYYVENHTHPIEGVVARQCALIARKYLGISEKPDLNKQCNIGFEKDGEIESILCVTANKCDTAPSKSKAPLIESRTTPVNTAPAEQPSSIQKDSSPIAESSTVQEERPSHNQPANLDDTVTMDSSVLLEEIIDDMTMDVDL